MGMMTVVVILNDAWSTIKENAKQFLCNIEEGMNAPYKKHIQDFSVGNHANPMKVHRSFHADNSQLLLVGQNHMWNIRNLDPNRLTDEVYLDQMYTHIKVAEQKVEFAKKELLNAIANMAKKKTCPGMTKCEVNKICKSIAPFHTLNELEQRTVIENVYSSVKDENGEWD